MKNTIFAVVLLSIVFLTAGCTGQQQPQQNATLTAQYGDTVSVDYTLRVDGTVVDTSLPDVARQAAIYDSSRVYQPISFSMVLGGQMIDGFVKGIVGMQQGETRNFTVSAADAYGLVDPSKITNQSRYYNMSVYEDVPMDYFVSQNITPKVGYTFPSAVGYVSVENITNDTVQIKYMLSPGQQFAVDGLPQTVVNITNDSMVIRFDVVQGETYNVTDESTGAVVPARAVYVDNQTMVMDENNPLAGKDLDFEVTVRSITQ
jgi:FKBP-type peptidyl-prolyl cis-trans isomerase SlyD